MDDLSNFDLRPLSQGLPKAWHRQTSLPLPFPEKQAIVFTTVLASMTIGISLLVPSSARAFNVNGIFSPRSSEHFFQQGLERFERNIEQLSNIYDQETLSEDDQSALGHPLVVDDSIEQQRQQIEDNGVPEFYRSPQSLPSHKVGK